jgi:thioredoxin reductase (NADPH)
MKAYELIIIGGGPAGLTAGIYAARYKLDTMIISRETGGMAATAHKVCNFPSYNEISGAKLTEKMLEHVTNLKVPIEYDNVEQIEKKIIKDDTTQKTYDVFEITVGSGKKINGKKIIFAAGSEHRKLNVPGEDKLLGRGVSYCATCDAGFFNDKTVAVLGGGNAALTSALMLAEHTKQVYLIYRRDNFFRAEPAWVESVQNNKKILIMFSEEITEIIGEKTVTAIKLKSNKTLPLDGVFIEIGSVPNTGILDNLNVELDHGLIKVDRAQLTNIPGFFAAGDITTNSNRFDQIITACAEGAVAVNSVFKELKSTDANKIY